MRDGIARLLGDKGFRVRTANNGRSAWSMLYTELPDLILLDLMMPEMSGLTFLRMLRSHHHWKELPVVVLTGLDHDEPLVQDARNLGVVNVIRKGTNIADLLLRQMNSLFPQTAEVTA